MELHITWFDLLVIYALPFGLVLGSLFVFLFILFVAVKMPRTTFHFKFDLLYVFDSQKNLKRYRNSTFPFLAFFMKAMLGDSGMQALFLYRISHWLHTHHLSFLRDLVHRLSKFLTQVDLSPFAIIGRGLNIYHGSGVVIGKNTQLGERCLVCQGVTTGSGAPVIGNDVKLWSGAKVLGNITIGDFSEVGANGVLIRSLEANCIALGVPANRIIRKVPKPS